MSSTLENQILNLQERLRAENQLRDKDKQQGSEMQQQQQHQHPCLSPALARPKQLGDMGTPTRPRRQLDLPVSHMIPFKRHDGEVESKLQEIMKMNGILTINGQKYHTDMKDLEHLGELGNGTCGHVVKMRHKPSGVVIAVKQMRRSGNADENKRIIMDLDVVLKSHDCPYIVQCLGCFITESDVWICMELMVTCLDKLLKRSRQAIPEDFLGKVTVATVKALSYLKEKHGVIHRDVKPSNILLDETGGVKLCDFGISGRLVDSKAKTRSAGCAAYMAPERIDPPDPTKPDYDIRADVWSLGITLVELATGVFPYRDCKTDFEVLSRVVQDDPPSLPSDALFSAEFQSFVSCCLTKNYKQRPKYNKLMEHPFIRKYEAQQDTNSSIPTSGCQWFYRVMQQLEPSFRFPGTSQRPSGHVSLKQTVHLRSQSNHHHSSISNAKEPIYTSTTCRSAMENGVGYVPYSPYAFRRRDMILRPYSPSCRHELNRHQTSNGCKPDDCANGRPYSPYRGSPNLANPEATRSYSPYCSRRLEERDGSRERWQMTPRSLSPFARDYSPWRRENVDPPVIQLPSSSERYSSLVQQRLGQISRVPHAQDQNAYASPMVSRKRFPSEPPPQGSHNSTSPQLLISRFAHQLKQEPPSTVPQLLLNNKESAKKRFTSYVRLRLGSDREPSPEPPPRFNRGESPLLLRRNLGEPASPFFPRRYVSPSPPVPPPRRLSESSSVPGSPQHLYSRLHHYTPEPQRRPPPP
ncbi:PREDICTED: dual specificity mitogen-activated protein kinase kinase 7-like [Ceratosolen solmsi marchali]|uniref:mitogen-activated protein kinase kinase n=1 Tax=Ceratosolen solmsi marchali TaxID=326594 RepID=A0AAJ6YXH0_9HYME|nr:PREDICTED: dual specificity mitogen-activated protein kinase kinase 7-like [Ceratosolen solmsi marchali]